VVKWWRDFAPFLVIATAGVAGLSRVSPASIIVAGLLLSLVRSKAVDQLTNEVMEEWRVKGNRLREAAVHVAVLAATMCGHLLFCGMLSWWARERHDLCGEPVAA